MTTISILLILYYNIGRDNKSIRNSDNENYYLLYLRLELYTLHLHNNKLSAFSNMDFFFFVTNSTINCIIGIKYTLPKERIF